MKKLALYGAGEYGKHFLHQCEHVGLEIHAVCDADESKLPVNGITLSELKANKEVYRVIITIKNETIKAQVNEMLTESGIEVVSEEKMLAEFFEDDIAGKNRALIAIAHKDTSYFDAAEQTANLDAFWREDSIFREMFDTLNLECVVELACGRGRHVQKYVKKSDQVILVDVLGENIDFCKERYKEENNIQYIQNNGHDFCDIANESCTALFTYDAVVHFEMLDIFAYLRETYRILKTGGRALIHHSNHASDYRITFETGIENRNYMSKELFAYMANRVGLTVVRQETIPWGGIQDLDCITLVEKRD